MPNNGEAEELSNEIVDLPVSTTKNPIKTLSIQYNKERSTPPRVSACVEADFVDNKPVAQRQRKRHENLTNNRPQHLAVTTSANVVDKNLAETTLYPIVIEEQTDTVTPEESSTVLVTEHETTTLLVELPKVTELRKRTQPYRKARRGKGKRARLSRDNNKHRKSGQQVEKKPVSPVITVHNYLETAILNNIEVLDDDVKKRKKRSSPLIVRNRVVTRRGTSVAPYPTAHDTELLSSNLNVGALTRSNNMSVYDRRYQQDDCRSAMTNGYLSSTRSSSAASAPLHSDADTQDQTQYYMAGTSATASTGPLLGNGSSVNHAPSMATLCNIGNSCYMNSVVYTLRFAPRFLHNLHHLVVDLNGIEQLALRHRAKSTSLDRGISGAAVENVRSWSHKDLSTMEQYGASGATSSIGGKLKEEPTYKDITRDLHELYHNLHHNEMSDISESFHADKLLKSIQGIFKSFAGNQQQDAHEFLMCVLNSIRETSQLLIKSVAECPEPVINSFFNNTDEVDISYPLDRELTTGNSTSSSSLSTNNITKASFFSRKSKRKEEGKSTKSSRLQSPLKDGSTGGNNGMPQQTANSLFYLNSVDLSGAHSSASPTTINQSNSSQPPGASSISSAGKFTYADDDMPVSSLLKDKTQLAEKVRELGLDYFVEDFEGITVSTTKCLSCETITELKESMIDIAVPVPISGYDSSDYTEKPNSFIQNSCITREYFRGENKYRCEQCTGYTEAIRSISFEVLPRLLVIQLSRFSGGMEKINSYIPTSFTLQCFCSKCYELSDANKLHIYKLYSVITHVGATMSVGHYIAYTCSLDWASEYVNCPKDRRLSQSSQQQQTQSSTSNVNGLPSSSGSTMSANIAQHTSSAASAAASALASSGTSLIKKMKFVRSKASSSGDMSKNMKNINGISSKTLINGIGKLSMNTMCRSLSCCSTRICNAQHQQQQQQHQASNSDLSEDSMQNGTNVGSTSTVGSMPVGYGSTGRGAAAKHVYGSSGSVSSNSSEPIWYMCDDDKIKAMTQREFEDLLSPSRKLTITPYLLFYARFDLQPTQSSPPNKPQASTPPHTSWSNESLQTSGVHKV